MSVAALLGSIVLPNGWKQSIADLMTWIAFIMAIGGLIVGIIKAADKPPMKQFLWVALLPFRTFWYIIHQIFGPPCRRIGLAARKSFRNEVRYVIKEDVPQIVDQKLQPLYERTKQLEPNGGSSIKDIVLNLQERLTRFENTYMKDTK